MRLITAMEVKILTGRRTRFVVLLAFGLNCLSIAQADPRQMESHDAIRAVAAEFARQQIDDSRLQDIEVKAAVLDPRLKLAPCSQPLEAFSTGNNRQLARTTVGVRCAGEKPWTLYVPVTVEAMVSVVYTSRPLLRGEALTSDTLEVREIPLAKLPLNHVSDTQQLAGMEAARALQGGVALSLNAVKPKQLIKQGQEVVIIAISGGIQVRMTGMAMRGGSQGELIPVQNSSSGRTIEAQVLDAGTVKVNF